MVAPSDDKNNKTREDLTDEERKALFEQRLDEDFERRNRQAEQANPRKESHSVAPPKTQEEPAELSRDEAMALFEQRLGEDFERRNAAVEAFHSSLSEELTKYKEYLEKIVSEKEKTEYEAKLKELSQDKSQLVIVPAKNTSNAEKLAYKVAICDELLAVQHDSHKLAGALGLYESVLAMHRGVSMGGKSKGEVKIVGGIKPNIEGTSEYQVNRIYSLLSNYKHQLELKLKKEEKKQSGKADSDAVRKIRDKINETMSLMDVIESNKTPAKALQEFMNACTSVDARGKSPMSTITEHRKTHLFSFSSVTKSDGEKLFDKIEKLCLQMKDAKQQASSKPTKQ